MVTLPGRFMRGRHAYAMLRMIDLEETIASDKDDYVDIAVKLGLDEAHRRAIAEQVRLRSDRLFDDATPIRALEGHIRRWAGG